MSFYGVKFLQTCIIFIGPDLKSKLGQCFSFYTNVRSLSERHPDYIVCLHALRVLSLALIILGQTYFSAYSSVLISKYTLISMHTQIKKHVIIGKYVLSNKFFTCLVSK